MSSSRNCDIAVSCGCSKAGGDLDSFRANVTDGAHEWGTGYHRSSSSVLVHVGNKRARNAKVNPIVNTTYFLID